jgi:hypothetical protein
LADYAVQREYIVGLVANGAMPHADQPLKVLPGRSPDQLARILEVLAGVTPFATASIDRLLRDESPNLPWGATLVVVTAVLTDELSTMLNRLRAAGRRVVLVGVDQESVEPPPGILCHHAPPHLYAPPSPGTPPNLYQQLKANADLPPPASVDFRPPRTP